VAPPQRFTARSGKHVSEQCGWEGLGQGSWAVSAHVFAAQARVSMVTCVFPPFVVQALLRWCLVETVPSSRQGDLKNTGEISILNLRPDLPSGSKPYRPGGGDQAC
jgi:hypothetical protein